MNVAFETGDMPEWKAVESMTMFAEGMVPPAKARVARSSAQPAPAPAVASAA